MWFYFGKLCVLNILASRFKSRFEKYYPKNYTGTMLVTETEWCGIFSKQIKAETSLKDDNQ